MATAAKDWQDLNLSRDELESMTKAFKNDDFKKMFFDYCEEIQSPENRRLYQDEITQLEAERGVQVSFVNPDPGFVVKTAIDGKTKGFVNIAKSDMVGRPRSTVQMDHDTGKQGLMWSIPLAQAPPRRDLDKKGSFCLVYDVIFHPDALRLAEKNAGFRKHLIETACDAVEREFKVSLDRTNLKFPKMTFKGVAQPTVIRKMSATVPEPSEPSPLDKIYPPLPEETKPKVFTTKNAPKSGQNRSKSDDYTVPQFVIKHRRGVDYSEMTYELDAKLNVTIPRELIVEILLPMLNSTSECQLDVTERKLYLVSTQPARYKLNIDLPYHVNDKDGSAKFDKATRKLVVTLPVCSEKERKLRDLLHREDSGVESDVREDSGNVSPNLDNPKVVELPDVVPLKSFSNALEKPFCQFVPSFLDSTLKYNFPSHFDCNTLDDTLAFTLHVKNVQPESLEHIRTAQSVHLKFSTIGSGFYPVHYAFYIHFPATSSAKIRTIDIEPWDNNVILSLALDNYEALKSYAAGPDPNELTDYPITEDFVVNANNKFNLLHAKDDLEVSVKPLPASDHVEIEIKSSQDSIVKETKKPPQCAGSKKHKKKNKKRRSFSESSCDDFKTIELLSSSAAATVTAEVNDGSGDLQAPSSAGRKIRSFSESRGNDCSNSHNQFKGILKHRSRYGRSISESCSSFDEHSSYSCSADFTGMGSSSFHEIPEEEGDGDDELNGLSESCKKTVRFSDVIKKQLFRLDSSILGQRKKNQKKKNQKQRAIQRRNSEGDSADYEDKSPRSDSMIRKRSQKVSKHDSGLDLSMEENDLNVTQFLEDTDLLSDHETSKNGLMFDLEM